MHLISLDYRIAIALKLGQVIRYKEELYTLGHMAKYEPLIQKPFIVLYLNSLEENNIIDISLVKEDLSIRAELTQNP